MSDDFETPPDIPYSLEPGKWTDGATMAAKFLSSLELRCGFAAVCESPIEVELAAVLEPLLADRYVLKPQFRIARFRYDFAILSLGGEPLLLIECDSKEFHSTDEQKANDRAKNRAAEDAGIYLTRISGSAIRRDPTAASENIVRILGGR